MLYYAPPLRGSMASIRRPARGPARQASARLRAGVPLAAAAVAAAALLAAAAPAEAERVVCGDRLCTEVPGGYAGWKKAWFPQAAPAAGERAEAPEAGERAEAPAERAAPVRMDSGAAWAAAVHGAGRGHTMTELADGVYHYYDGAYSSLVVVSPEGVLVTDPAHDARAAELKKAVAGIADAPVTRIVLTHEHYDHAGGTSSFEGAEVICHENCIDMFRMDPFGTAPQKVDTEFDEFMEIDVGGIAVELHYMGPADGHAATVIYLPEERIVATADLYLPRALIPGAWQEDVNFVGKHRVLGEVATWDIRHAVNAHSPGTDPEDLRENARFMADLYEEVRGRILEARELGVDGYFEALLRMPQEIELEEYSDWEGYEEHLPRHVDRMIYSMAWSTCGLPGCDPFHGR